MVYGADVETEVIRDRYWVDAVPLFSGEVPTIEYPPLALVFIAIPYLFGSTPWGYETAWVAMMVVVLIAGLMMTSRLARDVGCDESRAMVLYAVLCLVMWEFVLDRFDIIAMVLTLASVLLFVEKRYPWAFVLLAFGALVKVYPILLFPVFFIFLARERRWRDALVSTAAMLVFGVVVVAVFWLIDPSTVTNFLEYNTGRPLQIESVASSVVYVISLLGLTDVWIQPSTADGSFLSDNLRGPLADSLADWMLPLAIVLVIVVWALYLWRSRPGEGLELLMLASVACILVFMVFNKVFSTQYLIWLSGAVLVYAMVSPGRLGRRLVLLTVAALVLGQLDFAYNVGYLGGGDAIDTAGMLIILVKNAVVVWLMLESVWGMVRRERGPDDARAPANV